MKKTIVSSFLAILFLLPLSLKNGNTEETDSNKAEGIFKKLYPNTSFESMEETMMKGLFEVTMNNKVIYFHPETGNLIFGEIWTKEGKNITADRRIVIQEKLISTLPLDKAIRIGNGEHKVIEFSDPDCPYCKSAEQFFKERDDITRYVFLYPISQHQNAREKIKYILCSSAREEAYQEVMDGKYKSGEKGIIPICEGDTLLKEHLEVAKLLDVRGTPSIWVNGKQIKGGFNRQLIEQLLIEENKKDGK